MFSVSVFEGFFWIILDPTKRTFGKWDIQEFGKNSSFQIDDQFKNTGYCFF